MRVIDSRGKRRRKIRSSDKVQNDGRFPAVVSIPPNPTINPLVRPKATALIAAEGRREAMGHAGRGLSQMRHALPTGGGPVLGSPTFVSVLSDKPTDRT